jgi:hypothetical protein
MKHNISKNGNEITLTVTLNKKEMKAEENIAFGYRKARQYLIDKGYEDIRLLSESAAANKGGNASKDGKFVFELGEKSTNQKKTSKKSSSPSTKKKSVK